MTLVAKNILLRTSTYGTLFIFLFQSACALYTGSQVNPVVTTCNIPADQFGTISGHWKETPIPIAFHQGDFGSTELTAMTNASDTWNTFFTTSKSISLIDYGGDNTNPRISTVGDPTTSGTLCAHSVIQNTTYSGDVVIYKLGAWPSSYPASAIALTSYCTYTGKPYSYIYMAVMEINYQNFFVSGQKLPDLQSIVLHELGHVQGLKHTCENTTLVGTPNCNSATLDPSYVTASMYPVFSFDNSGNGQVKQALGSNDQYRANCLYPTNSAASPTPTVSTTPH